MGRVYSSSNLHCNLDAECPQVSNVTDRGYLGPKIVLDTFCPLLKPKTDNLHATLGALFLNAVHEVSTLTGYLKLHAVFFE